MYLGHSQVKQFKMKILFRFVSHIAATGTRFVARKLEK